MWAVAAIFICLVVLFLAYIFQSARMHDRDELNRVRKEIEDAKRELDEALSKHPEDGALHVVIGNRLDGLRKREAELR